MAKKCVHVKRHKRVGKDPLAKVLGIKDTVVQGHYRKPPKKRKK